jgi:hypothetical protein
MSTSDVRSIDSLRELRLAMRGLAHDWDQSIQQIRFSMHRVEEHFTTTLPNYWHDQTRKAEQKLAEATDNLSRQQGNATDGNAPAVTEAKQRVQKAKRRLALCEEKWRAAKRISLKMEQACTELAGPLAEVMAHAEVTLPRGAEDLASLIAHLDRYAETASPPSLLANPTSPANPVSPAKEDTKS